MRLRWDEVACPSRFPMRVWSKITVMVSASLLVDLGSLAAPADGDVDGFFAKEVRPILKEHCYKCHSHAAGKNKGGLVVDSVAGILAGGDNGPAVVPGEAAKSLLIKAVRQSDADTKMPPKGEPLSAMQIAAIEKWVALGAHAPAGEKPAAVRGAITDEDRHWWAFQPLRETAVSHAEDHGWVRNDIDRFIHARLKAAGLEPSPEADRVTLLRRVFFDLIGLPPSPEEVDAFLADKSGDAYERLVDRLLASPRYGERWGRHWLDLARYADSSGFHNDLDRPHAWRYRDYVIGSFNDDKPYAQFVAEQLAGDEIAGAGEDGMIATGFCRNGPSNDDNMGNDKEQYRLDELDDVISTTSSVFLGLTVGCARCHDHKYDPISAEDYYRLLAVFNCTEKHGVPKETKAKGDESDPGVQALIETGASIRPTFLLRRGSLQNKGPEVQPGVPAVLGGGLKIPAPAPDARSTGRRRALAEWIASSENSLAYRVLANRIWQHHFGAAIVATPSNFGVVGARPTHPELLDWLARQLIENGGRLKPLHRLILLSATYRQSSRHHEAGDQRDPQNSLLWRMNRQRLEAEILRDSILAVSGKLNLEMGGKGIKPRIRADLLSASQRNKWPTLASEGSAQWRRSVYIYVKRQLLMPMMELFDAPATTDSCARRTESVLPTQALVLMNDEFVEDQAGFLARRAAGAGTAKAVERMFVLALARRPERARLEQAVTFVRAREEAYRGENPADANAAHRALADLAHVLLNSSEFLHVE